MAFRLDPAIDLTENVRKVGTSQIDNVLKRLSAKSGQNRAVHEARKSMKRLRALLRLARPAMGKAEFKREETRLKQIGRSLSGLRDVQAMLECMTKLETAEPEAADNPVAIELRSYFEEKCRKAESELRGKSGSQFRKQLRVARQYFSGIELEGDGIDIIAKAIRKDYDAARKAFFRAYKLNEDEAFHDWRKLVQRQWRQLLLIEPGWPSGIRPHIAMVDALAEMLGDDHDLYMLAGHIRDAGKTLGSQKQIKTYLALCRKRQDTLREHAKLIGERLFAESPASLSARLTAYWKTQPAFLSVFGETLL